MFNSLSLINKNDFLSFWNSLRRTHHFLKREKRVADLFKTFNVTIRLQKTADDFWSEHVFEFYSTFRTIETMIVFYQILLSKDLRKSWASQKLIQCKFWTSYSPHLLQFQLVGKYVLPLFALRLYSFETIIKMKLLRRPTGLRTP